MADEEDTGQSEQDQGSGEQKQQKENDRKREEQRKKSRPWVWGGVIVFVVLIVVGGGLYWWLTRFSVSTDDAFTAGRTITIAPHVSGYVTELDVDNNQFVRQGEVLMRVDPRNYQASLDEANASLTQAQGQLQGAKFGVEVAKVNYPGQLKEAQGQVLIAQAQEFNAETEYKRQHSIARAATTQQAIDQSTASLKQAQGTLEQAQGRVEQNSPTLANVSTSRTRVQQYEGMVAQAKAQRDTAKLNLGWTVVRAPHDGWIAQRNVERGNYVTAGQAVFSIVEPEVWVTANFKETQITKMRPGQPATIAVDAFPLMHLSGHVDSIQNGSGSTFSAFPPENATGNYVKIVQRVPVKIIIDAGMDPNVPLPLGISVEPTVNVKSASK